MQPNEVFISQDKTITHEDFKKFNEVIPDLDNPTKTEIDLAYVMNDNIDLKKQLKYESNISEKFLLSQINECKDVIKKLARLL